MMHLGLVGYPLKHSFSPAIHEAAMRCCGLRGEYSLYAVPETDGAALRQLVNRLRDGEITGLNVTIPHKQAILQFVDTLTPEAQAIGAVNVLHVQDGSVVGQNTDCAAFITDLLAWLPAPRLGIVLGAGGAARAVIHGLATLGCKVHAAARRPGQSRELLARFANIVSAGPISDDLLRDPADLVVNATPAGMFPRVDGCAWPEAVPLPAHAAVYDLVYNPRQTRLLSRARAQGLLVRNGLGMLVEQAALAFELWTGCRAPRPVMSEAVSRCAG